MLQQRNMGDSSACAMKPFSYSSGFPNESNNNKRNPYQNNGDVESVSFGRLMRESLAWEKWSTFSSTQNRYVEEAERISKPGSVAQKKAFFEAHYKKLAAQKAEADTLQELSVNEECDRISNIVTSLHQTQNNIVENEMQNQLQHVVKKGSSFDKQVVDSMIKKKAPKSSLENGGTSKFLSTTINSSALTVSDSDNIVTQNPIRKKISNAKSLHMSLKFAFIRVMRKLETTRVGDGSSTASMDNWTPLTTKSKVSMNELQKHPSFATLKENNRNRKKSEIISSPLGLRTEERDANENKKLEKKTNAVEAHKKNLHIKIKEKAVIKIKKLRPSCCFKARPLSEFDNENEVSKIGTKEDFLTPSESVKKSSSSSEILFHENTSSNIHHGN